MSALYNEIEPFAARWLENLSAAGHIATGRVDARSIKDITPADLAGVKQAHFFAGIGVWSYALRLAGVPDDAPVWTGSCPCQPFSQAGLGGGFDDPRHLWPDWFNLIRECRPPVVFGEQVASRDGYHWLDLVSADLEGAGYAFGAAVLPAAGCGAPHLRHRIFFVAYVREQRRDGFHALLRPEAAGRLKAALPEVAGGGAPGGIPDTNGGQCDGIADGEGRDLDGAAAGRKQGDGKPERDSPAGGLGDDSDDARLEGHWRPVGVDGAAGRDAPERLNPTSGFWGGAAWLPFRDGKWRPIEPGTFPLVDGSAARVGAVRARENASRVGQLRGYGNAIVGPLAATFIRAAMEAA